jgi:hypothetical protein
LTSQVWYECEGKRRMSVLPGEESDMRTVLIILLVLLVLGALPTWPYSASWGYYPSGGLGLLLLILLVFVFAGRG